MSDGMIDPNDPEWEKPQERYYCREGEHIWQAVGMERDKTARGFPTLTVHCVCLDDPTPPDDTLTPPTDAGMLCSLRFTLAEGGGKSFFVRSVKAMGYTQPFDMHNDDHIVAIFFEKPFIGTVKNVTKPNQRGEPRTYSEVLVDKIAPGVFRPEWKDLFNGGLDKYEEMLKKRAERQAADAAGGGGGRRGGGKPKPQGSVGKYGY